jgi:hypothetical protein
MLERLKRAPPLPYHLSFMIRLASGVPPSSLNSDIIVNRVSNDCQIKACLTGCVYRVVLPVIYFSVRYIRQHAGSKMIKACASIV